jgi:Protein of unknown function (DUF4058)
MDWVFHASTVSRPFQYNSRPYEVASVVEQRSVLGTIGPCRPKIRCMAFAIIDTSKPVYPNTGYPNAIPTPRHEPLFRIPRTVVRISQSDDRGVDLQLLLHQIYDRARLALAIDYQKPPIPKLSLDDRAWLNVTLSQGQYDRVGTIAIA